MSASNKIRLIRQVTGLTQQELADMAGVSRALISRMETDDLGPGEVSQELLDRIAKALAQVQLGIFLERKGD